MHFLTKQKHLKVIVKYYYFFYGIKFGIFTVRCIGGRNAVKLLSAFMLTCLML